MLFAFTIDPVASVAILPKLHSLAALARALGVSKRVLTTDIAAGRLRSLKLAGRRYVADEDVRRYLTTAAERSRIEAAS